MKMIKVEDAVGTILSHDVTQIIPGEFKGRLFKKGHIIKEEDIEKLAYTCCYGKGNEGGRIGGFVSLEQKDVEAIYRLML